MGRATNLTKDMFLDAIERHEGFMTVTDLSKSLGITWSSARHGLDKYKDVYEAFNSKTESALDELEKEAFERSKSDKKDSLLLRYMLSTKAKNRGYAIQSATIQQTTNNNFIGGGGDTEGAGKYEDSLLIVASRDLKGNVFLHKQEGGNGLNLMRGTYNEFFVVTASNSDISDNELIEVGCQPLGAVSASLGGFLEAESAEIEQLY